MTLVFIHGRGQEGRDPGLLRRTWLQALTTGAAAADVTIRLGADDVLMPYYGDVLADLTGSSTDDDEPPLTQPDDPAHDLPCLVVADCLDGAGVTEAAAIADPERSRVHTLLSWEWIQTGLSLLDRYVPGASARSLAWAAHDVATYLDQPDARRRINREVARAFDTIPAHDEVVVIAHSLGSVVAYDLLRPGGQVRRPIRAVITIGSPLGIRAIRSAIGPVADPPAVDHWFNAYDERDVIALYPLEAEQFPFDPPIDNFGGVVNDTVNHHGITGYLSDPTVVRSIAEFTRPPRIVDRAARWLRSTRGRLLRR